jgi:hypothetical protein
MWWERGAYSLLHEFRRLLPGHTGVAASLPARNTSQSPTVSTGTEPKRVRERAHVRGKGIPERV